MYLHVSAVSTSDFSILSQIVVQFPVPSGLLSKLFHTLQRCVETQNVVVNCCFSKNSMHSSLKSWLAYLEMALCNYPCSLCVMPRLKKTDWDKIRELKMIHDESLKNKKRWPTISYFYVWSFVLERGRDPAHSNLNSDSLETFTYALMYYIQHQHFIVPCAPSSSLLQVTTGWETPTQTLATVRSPLAPASSVTPLLTWPRRRGDSATLEESGNRTSGVRGWNEEPPPTPTSTASGRNTQNLSSLLWGGVGFWWFVLFIWHLKSFFFILIIS